MDISREFLVCCAVLVALFVAVVLLGVGSRERGTPAQREPGEGGEPPWQGEAQHAEDGKAHRGTHR
jgi:hypothetical protein